MARVLVIGGTLFIGRTLVERLLERGDDVVIMHRGDGTPFGTHVEEIQCDRNDIARTEAALRDTKFDLVFDNVYDMQRGTTAAQVSAAATTVAGRVRRYVFTSSVAVYPPGGEYDEDARLVPSDSSNGYGAQKADSERALFALGPDHGLRVTTVRPTFIYGPNNVADRESFFWDRLVADRPILIPDDGLTTMQWVYSQDVARASILAAETGAASGRAYNLANYPALTQIDFVRLLARVAGKDANLVHIPRAKIQALGGGVFAPPFYFGVYLDVPPITVRSDRVCADLGFEFTPLEVGLRDTFEWYTRQTRPRPDFSWDDKALAAT